MGELNHADPALRDPSDTLNYETFPITALPARIFRAKRKAVEAWFFASVSPQPTPENPGGRFDLASPRGTSYWADDAAAALRERLGPNLTQDPGRIPQYLLDTTEVVSADGSSDSRFADLSHPDATVRFGVTGELSSTSNYPRTQRYAAVFADAGLDGVRYRARFSGDGTPNAAAIFGVGGVDTTRTVHEDAIEALDVAVQMGLQVIPSATTADASEFTIIDTAPPPRT